MSDFTSLLASARQGDEGAARQAFALLYEDLRRQAHRHLRRHQSMTFLDTTSLVHECFAKFVGVGTLGVADRRHFFAYASRVMRSVIVDFARARLAERRGGGAEHVVLDTGASSGLCDDERDVLQVHEALQALEAADPRAASVVELRYFGGLSEPEIAEALDLSERTVRRAWEKARLLLAELLR